MPDATLIACWIEPNPHRPGEDEVRLARYGVPVWAIVGYYLGIGEDVDQTARDYAVPSEAVQAAVAYYAQHKPLIDARLRANLPESMEAVTSP